MAHRALGISKPILIGRQLHLVVKVIVKLIHILFGGFKVDYKALSLQDGNGVG